MREGVRFLLNGEAVALADVDPRVTLLDWLREARGLKGTKEGCNEGDCGACTVGVTRLEGGVPRRRAVNACIQLLPMLDGAAVTTVEALAGPHRLHPAQQAMAVCHGAQCGFCTPGIVMSLWAGFDGPAEGRAAQCDRLAGNLCRCTGYGPILEAAEVMRDLPPPDWERDLGPGLAALPGGGFRLAGGGAEAWAPGTEAELAEVLAARPDALLVAGATDVGLWLTKRLERPGALVFLHRVVGFDRVVETPEGVEIGAGATWTDAASALGRLAPDLGELVRRFASVQVRNSATVGGNVANGSPIGDGSPALMALGARAVLRSAAGEREVALEDFFLGYGRQDRRAGEYLAALRAPRPSAGTLVRVWKVSKRFDQDISAVLGAFAVRIEDGRVARARIAFGGMAAVPKRARAVEAALEGRAWTDATVRAALPAFAEDFRPIDDLRASATYRLTVARNLLVALHDESRPGAAPVRLAGGLA